MILLKWLQALIRRHTVHGMVLHATFAISYVLAPHTACRCCAGLRCAARGEPQKHIEAFPLQPAQLPALLKSSYWTATCWHQLRCL